MVQLNELKAAMVRKGLKQADVAKAIGISNKTFYEHMKKGVFGSDEIEKLINLLDIKDPLNVFFAR